MSFPTVPNVAVSQTSCLWPPSLETNKGTVSLGAKWIWGPSHCFLPLLCAFMVYRFNVNCYKNFFGGWWTIAVISLTLKEEMVKTWEMEHTESRLSFNTPKKQKTKKKKSKDLCENQCKGISSEEQRRVLERLWNPSLLENLLLLLRLSASWLDKPDPQCYGWSASHIPTGLDNCQYIHDCAIR